jgi:hypothetical protein
MHDLLRQKRSSVFVQQVHEGTRKNADLWLQFEALSKKHLIEGFWESAPSKHKDSQ